MRVRGCACACTCVGVSVSVCVCVCARFEVCESQEGGRPVCDVHGAVVPRPSHGRRKQRRRDEGGRAHAACERRKGNLWGWKDGRANDRF
eukprot:6172114-Pleurochrysis_carterae.AAC.1